MNRCFSFAPLLLAVVLPAAHAQSSRDADRTSGVVLSVPADSMATGDSLGRVFPPNAHRGVMRILATPEVILDGKPERLSPGARIRDTQNMVVQSSGLTGVSLVVNYRKNAGGELHDVWLLSAAEAKAKLPSMEKSNAQRSDLPKDDGKTPFDQLPKWNPNTPR